MNSISISGNVGREPELRKTPQGKSVTDFSLACRRRDGETVWFRVTCWEAQAELVAQYVHKGQWIAVTGEFLGNNPWTSSAGERMDSLEVKADRIDFGPKQEGDGPTFHMDSPGHSSLADMEAVPF